MAKKAVTTNTKSSSNWVVRNTSSTVMPTTGGKGVRPTEAARPYPPPPMPKVNKKK